MPNEAKIYKPKSIYLRTVYLASMSVWRVHKAFDDLADNINGKDAKDILREVDLIMNLCVGCHATYKLETEK